MMFRNWDCGRNPINYVVNKYIFSGKQKMGKY